MRRLGNLNGFGQLAPSPAVVTSYSPTTGGLGTKVVIVGYNFSTQSNDSFGSNQGQTHVTGVKFSGAQGTTIPVYDVDNDRQITVTVPSGLIGDQKLTVDYTATTPAVTSYSSWTAGRTITSTLNVGTFVPTEQAQQAATQAVTQQEQNLQIDLTANKSARDAFNTAQTQFQAQQTQLTTQQAALAQGQANLQTMISAQQTQEAQFKKTAMMAGIGGVLLLVIILFLLKD